MTAVAAPVQRWLADVVEDWRASGLETDLAAPCVLEVPFAGRKRGRPAITRGGVPVTVARAILADAGLEVEGRDAAHLCREAACVQPRHLAALTPSEHRQLDFGGERSTLARLTEADVELVRHLHRCLGVNQYAVADLVGCHQGTVSLACSGKTWRAVAARPCPLCA